MIGKLFIVGIRKDSLKRVWGLYIKAAMQPSAGAGESGDKNRVIKRSKNIFAYSATIISWNRRFCQVFFPFF